MSTFLKVSNLELYTFRVILILSKWTFRLNIEQTSEIALSR